MRYGNDVHTFQEQGTHALCVAKRELDDGETFDLVKLLGEVHLQWAEQRRKIDNYLLRLCTDMKSLGVVGLKSGVCERNSLVVEELKRNGLKLFVMS